MTTIRRPRHDSGIEIGPEIDREAEVRRRNAEADLQRAAQAVEAPFGFENLPPAEQELFRLRQVSEQQFGGEREFGSFATEEERVAALRERLLAQSRSVERTVAQPTQDIQQVAAERGVQLTGARRTGEQIAAGRALEQEVAAGAVPVTVTETLQEQQRRAQRNPMTYLNIISTIADPFGYVTADLGAMAGRNVGGDIGEMVGGILGGIAGPIPRNPTRVFSRGRSAGSTLGIDVLPGVSAELAPLVRRRLDKTRGLVPSARTIDRVSPVGTARAFAEETIPVTDATRRAESLGDSVLRAIRNGESSARGFDDADIIRANIDTLEEIVKARTSAEKVVRPRWAVGISDEELRVIAKQEGVDVAKANWHQNIDQSVVRDARRGAFKAVNTKSITAIRNDLRAARRQLKELEATPTAERVRRPILAQLEEAMRQARTAGDEETLRHLQTQSRQAILGVEDSNGRLTGGIIPAEDANLVRELTLEAQSKREASKTVQHAADKKRLLDEARRADKEAQAITDHWLNYNAAEEAGMFDDYLTTARAGSGDALTASTRDSARLAEQAREVAEAEVAGTRALSMGSGQEAWQITRREFAETGFTPGDSDALIRQSVGSGKAVDILKAYQKRHPELKGVRIGGWEPTTASGPLKDVGVSRIIFKGGKFDPSQSWIHLSSDASPTTVRHEIEHLLDAVRGFKGDPSNASFTRFRHEFFASDFTHRQLVKQAASEGRPIPPEVLAEHPGIKPRAGAGNAPPRKPGTPRGSGSGTPPPRDPALALADDMDIPPYEKPETFFLQKMDGSIKTRATELNLFGRDAERLRKSLGFKGKLGPEDGEPILRAFHGELPLSQLTPQQRAYFDFNAARRNMIQDEKIAFLKNAAEGDQRLLNADIKTWLSRIFGTPDYLPRLWKAREGASPQVGSGRRFGATPGAARSRNERTFTEMREDGWDPLSWDPADMIALADYEWTIYRAQIVMANALRRHRKLLPLSEAKELGFTEPRGIAGRGPKIVSGWRKPEGVGTVFDGRQVPDPQNPGEFIKAEAFVVPNDVADTLEIMFGPRPKVTVHGVDVLGPVIQLSNNLKRIKVISLFQDVDIAMTRTLAASFSGKAGVVMGPWRHASLLAQWAAIRTMPNKREALRRLFMSDEKIRPGISNSPTYRQVSEAGLGIFGDTTFIDREILRATREIAASRGGRVPKVVMDRLNTVKEFYESGLFEGVYPLAAKHYMEHATVPRIARRHADWTAEQVAAIVAKETNLAISSQGVWQSAIKGRVFRQISGLVLFSPNELESLVGQAVKTLPFRGNNEKLFWAKHFLSMYLGMAVIANVINISSTGKPLPAEGYSPVKLNDPYALWGVGYNNRFMAPQAPVLRGRNEQPVYIDLVGQMDSVFMLLADPFEAMASRLNVIPRAVTNWIAGSSFMGHKNDTFVEKSTQAAIDLGLPISGNSALSVFQQHSEKFRDIVPQQEGRIGTAGNVVQGLTGVNIRGTTTRELLDTTAERRFGAPYDALEPYQKRDVRQDPSVSPELGERSREGTGNVDVQRSAFSRLDEIDRERIAEEENLLKLRAERRIGIDELRTRYKQIQATARDKREERGLDIDDRSEDPGSPNEAALESFYALLDQDLPWKEEERAIALLERNWTAEQRDYVLRNTNDTVHAEGIFRLLPASTRRRISQSEAARQRHMKAIGAR